jgi:Zn-dependent protease with chaperone function
VLEALEAETGQDAASQAGFLSTHPSNPERILQLMDAMPKALEEKNRSGMISAPVLVK